MKYLLRAIVAKESLVESLPDLARITWRKNRSANLVGFRIDKKSQLVAESHVPKFGITPRNFSSMCSIWRLKRIVLNTCYLERMLIDPSLGS